MAIDPSAVWDFAKEVIGAARPDRGRTLATVTRVDADGTTWVTTGDGGEAPAGSSMVGVKPGDVVGVEWTGSAMGITGNVTAPPVGEREVRSAVAPAQKAANTAKEIAEAVGQFFWHDDGGAHISTEAGNPTGGRNALWNSLGMLFRAGTSNLLALVTGDDPGMDVYNGEGNAAGNIIAAIHGSGIRIGLLSGLHSLVSAKGFAIDYGSDNVFKVSTDGVTTEIYAGGSTLPTGVTRTNAAMKALRDYFNSGCTPFVDGDVAYVLDPHGDYTGYTLNRTDLSSAPSVLDGDGRMLCSADYSDLYWWSEEAKWGLSYNLVPMAEVDTMPCNMSAGGVKATMSDKHMVLEADNMAVDWDGRIDGYMLGDFRDTGADGTQDTRYGTVAQASPLALKAGTGKAVCSHEFEPGAYLVTGHVYFSGNANGYRAAALHTVADTLPSSAAGTVQSVAPADGHQTHLQFPLIWCPTTTSTLYLNALSSVALNCQGQIRWVRLL